MTFEDLFGRRFEEFDFDKKEIPKRRSIEDFFRELEEAEKNEPVEKIRMQIIKYGSISIFPDGSIKHENRDGLSE